MKIGIDARFWGLGSAGLGRYTIELIENLTKVDRENQYYILLNHQGYKDFKIKNANFHKFKVDAPHYSFKEQFSFPWKLRGIKLDLVHFTHFSHPIFYRGPFIITIHDLTLSSYSFSGRFSRIKNMAYNLVLKSAIKNSRKIIAVSEFTKKDIVKNYNIKPEKIAVTYEAADLARYEPRPDSLGDIKKLKEKYKLDKPFLLYTGQQRHHKNLVRLVQAFQLLLKKYHQDIGLVLVGKKDERLPELPAEIERLNLTDRVIFTGFVEENELPLFYNAAGAFVFPSLAEGFGLPPLEAMASGVPVISSNASCMPEILGEAAHYFNPFSVGDMAKQIDKVLRDGTLQKKLINLGQKQVIKYNFEKMARETKFVYETTIKN